MEVLVYLVLEAGKVVSHEEILEAVWPETFIQDSVLFRRVSALRRILGDDAHDPRFIETIPKRGYRLIAAVSRLDRRCGSEPSAAPTSMSEEPGKDLRPVWLTAMLAALALCVLATRGGPWLPREQPPSRAPASPYSPAAPRPGSCSGPATGQPSVAVLPFDHEGLPAAGQLSIALADEVTTALSHAPDLRVRPFSLTRRHATDGMDPRAVGRKVQAERVIAGRLALEGEMLSISLEGIDVEDNTIFWRRNLRVAAADPSSLRRQIAVTVRQDLLPALEAGGPAAQPDRGSSGLELCLSLCRVAEGGGPGV